MDPYSELVAALASARDAGLITHDETTRALGELMLDACGVFGDHAQPSWRDAIAAVGIDEDLINASYAALGRGRGGERSGRAPLGDEVDLVIERIDRTLGDPSGWPPPTAYRSSALAVLDSIWSIGVRYAGVQNLIERYLELRATQEADADGDTPTDLVAVIEQLGGPGQFADAVGNRQRTSSKNGILKAEAVLHAAQVLVDAGLHEPADVLATGREELGHVREAWLRVHGQGSGISFDYFLMLSGMPGVKGDRMIRRFIAKALGLANELSIDATRAVDLVCAAAERLEVDIRKLDFAIWEHESERAGRIVRS